MRTLRGQLDAAVDRLLERSFGYRQIGDRHRSALIGEPDAAGIVRTSDPYIALHAIVEHRAGLVDPPPLAWLLAPLWWALRRDGLDWRGPELRFLVDDYTPPTVPPGGLDAAELLAAYLAAAPVPLPSPAGRIAIRAYREPPAMSWRRVERENLRTTPSPAALAAWHARLQRSTWRAFALHRFVADLAAGSVVAFSNRGEDVPMGDFWRSDLELDTATGDLSLIGFHHPVPMFSRLRLCSRGDRPPLVDERHRLIHEHGSVRAAVAAELHRHPELAGLRLVDAAEPLRRLLPMFTREQITGGLGDIGRRQRQAIARQLAAAAD